MPKRERKGAERRPSRVVAPTRVKGCRVTRTDRAEGPESMTMSMA